MIMHKKQATRTNLNFIPISTKIQQITQNPSHPQMKKNHF